MKSLESENLLLNVLVGIVKPNAQPIGGRRASRCASPPLCTERSSDMKWLIANKEWVFSGVGVFVLSIIIGIVFKNKGSVKQVQKSGDNSSNYQAAGDIKIGRKDD